MARREQQIEHLLRRAGFGGSPDEVDLYAELGVGGATDLLLNYEQAPDDVDAQIGQAGYVGVTTRGQFAPSTVITDARQRWLFRMVHTRRPLQEKMALFWHNHFATAYSKINDTYGSTIATAMLAGKPGESPGNVKGQLELFRQFALGNFRDLLIAVAKDPAMLVWLDGRLNTKNKPQENFAREVMELFTFGVANVQEPDVYAAARVFSGWNLRAVGASSDPGRYYEYFFNAAQHDTAEKVFTFDIYPGGNKVIPARAATEDDGYDFINAIAAHPETGPRLVRKLYAYFVNERQAAPQGFVNRIAGVYYGSGYDMRQVIRAILLSPEFYEESAYFARYSWPPEFVVRAIKETGWVGFSVDSALTPLINMGQQLFEPPDVNGWELGEGWFSTSGMLSRMNFGATLTTNQRVNLRNAARPFARTPQSVLSFVLDRLSPASFETAPYNELLAYLRAGTNWTGSDTELQAKVSGLTHLVLGSAYYQLV
jgi:uncharacterized protein (DUF1800 family)